MLSPLFLFSASLDSFLPAINLTRTSDLPSTSSSFDLLPLLDPSSLPRFPRRLLKPLKPLKPPGTSTETRTDPLGTVEEEEEVEEEDTRTIKVRHVRGSGMVSRIRPSAMVEESLFLLSQLPSSSEKLPLTFQHQRRARTDLSAATVEEMDMDLRSARQQQPPSSEE